MASRISCVLALSALLFLTACGGGSSEKSTAVPAVLTSISPTSVAVGAGATTLQLTGSNFVSGSVVTFNGSDLATTYASASMHAFASFFGRDQMTFYATSSRFPIDPLQPREKRYFSRFSDLTNEILGARIWAGIHFRNADVQAANLGKEVEHYIHTQYFAFVH